MDEPMFPILHDPIIKALPWTVFVSHQAQAKANHGGQSLSKLASRGGLSIEEAYCGLKDIPWQRGTWNKDNVRIMLMRMVKENNVMLTDPSKPTA